MKSGVSIIIVSVIMSMAILFSSLIPQQEPAIKLHRVEKIITQQANVWEDVVFHIKVDSESNSGISYDNTTGIITFEESGLYYISGCVRPVFEGGGNPVVDIAVRVIKSDDGGVTWRELRCLQSFEQKARGDDEKGTQTYSGTCSVVGESLLRLQTKVSNVNMNFEGWDGFDNPVSASFQAFRFSD